MSLEKAKDILLHQVPCELFAAHNAFGIYAALGSQAQYLNATRWCQLLGIIQLQSLGSMILSVSKIFEPVKKKYSNYSIPTALELISKDCENLQVSPINCVKLFDFITANESQPLPVTADTGMLRDRALKMIREQCPQCPVRPTHRLDEAFKAVKVVRDKQVAHHEDHALSELSSPDSNAIQDLLAFAQTTVDVIGFGFFGFSMRSAALRADFAPDRAQTWQKALELTDRLGRREQKNGQ